MRISPLVRRRRAPVGLVLSGGSEVIGEWCGRTWDKVPTNARLYCLRKGDLWPAIRRGEGRMRVWRGVKVTGFDLGGIRVTSLRGVLTSEPEEALEELRAWAEWLRENGANVGSLSGSAWSLWRSSLRSVFVHYGEEPDPERYTTGGRQGDIGAGTYTDVEMWDLTAAYAHTLGALAVPTQWRRWPGFTDSIPDEPGYARAAVAIPPGEWGPLPDRIGPAVVSWPTRTELEGVWTFDELRVARDHGCEVLLCDLYTSTSHRVIFANWWRMVEAGRRDLTGGAGRLVKASSNTLWGKFLAGGSAAWWSFPDGADGELLVEEETFRESPKAPALAGLVAGRIRSRVYAEALAKVPVISVHTDGVITPAGQHLSPNTGAPGCWRLKDTAERLELVTAQSFRYRRADGTMEYRVAGVPPSRAPDVFSRLLRPFQRETHEPPDDVAMWRTMVSQWDRVEMPPRVEPPAPDVEEPAEEGPAQSAFALT